MDRWDLLVLTAGDQSQKKSFELHLASMQLHEFIDDYRIFADYPVGAKIGNKKHKNYHQIVSRRRWCNSCCMLGAYG
jgi:hypothetical protein